MSANQETRERAAVKFIPLLDLFAKYKAKQYKIQSLLYHSGDKFACVFQHKLDKSELVVRFTDSGKCLTIQAKIQLVKDIVDTLSQEVSALVEKRSAKSDRMTANDLTSL